MVTTDLCNRKMSNLDQFTVSVNSYIESVGSQNLGNPVNVLLGWTIDDSGALKALSATSQVDHHGGQVTPGVVFSSNLDVLTDEK